LSSGNKDAAIPKIFSIPRSRWIRTCEEETAAYNTNFCITTEISENYRGFYYQYDREFDMPVFCLTFFPDTSDTGLNRVEGYGADSVGSYNITGSY
jgi:hypothetical protein